MGVFNLLQIIGAVIAIALIVSWIIMPWKVLGMAEDLKENNKHLEDLKKIQFEQLQELKKMNGNGSN
jgi:uncharacterized protein YoxC